MKKRLLSALRSRGAWILAPLFVAAVTYARTLWADFVWDDEYYFSRAIVEVNTLYTILFPGKALQDLPYYRPVASLSSLVLYWFSGRGSPWLWHLSNVVSHLVATAGVFALLRRWVANQGPGERADLACVAGATLFACWPANVEAIVFVSARTEGLMVCFLIWAVVLHLRSLDSGRTSLAAAALFLLALLSKETAIVFLPLVIAATVLLPAKAGVRAGLSASLWLPHVLAYLTYSALRGAVLGGKGTSLSAIAVERLKPEAVEPAIRAWAYYLREAWLLGPGAPYTETPPTGLGMLIFGIAGVIAGSVVIAVCSWRASRRPWAMCVIWFVLALGPPIAIAVEPLSITAVAMRYLYAPSVALAAAAALLVMRLPPVGERTRLAASLAAAAVCGLVVLAQVRMSPWMNSEALWARAVEDEPHSPVAQLNLGLVYVSQDKFVEGEKHLRYSAYGTTDADANRKQTCLVRLAEFYVSRGKFEDARIALRKASTLHGSRDGTVSQMALSATLEMLEHRDADGSMSSRVPRNQLLQQIAPLEYAASLDPADTSSRLVLAVVNEALGEKARARNGYLALARIAMANNFLRGASLARADRLAKEIAAETDPVKKLYFQAQEYEAAGDLAEAVRAYQAALALEPDRSDLLTPLAEIAARSGDLRAAVSFTVRATKAEPENPFHWFNLGLYRSLLGDRKGADDAYRRASEISPRWWRPYYHRASGLEGLGDKPGAIAQYERMLEVYEGVEPFRDHARKKVRDLGAQIGRNPSPEPGLQ